MVALLMAALVKKGVDLLRYVIAKDGNGALTTVVALGVGVAVAFLVAASDFAAGVEVAGRTLANMNDASVVLVGLGLGATGSVGWDALRAIDNSQSAAVPPLLK